MAELPTGTVTFLFTDLEGSTRLWEQHPEAMREALARHDAILRDAVEHHRGQVVKATGDGLLGAFAVGEDGVAAALTAQRELQAQTWETTGPLRVRMGLHSGSAEVRAGDYHGPALNRAARLMAVAHGGQVVCSQATADLVRDSLPNAAGLADLGDHGLRDLGRPERVFQVTHPDLPSDFEPLRSLEVFPGNLPAQVTSFIGRDRELATVVDALGDSRLVTLTGVGGVGKTRLAVQVAASVLPRYPDGAWMCELAAAEDVDSLLQLVAAALVVRSRAAVSLEQSVLEFLRSKRVLLVFDNCEHLLDAAARFIENVLRECPHVRVLATSREVLAVAGEHVVGLRSLACADPASDLARIVSSDAVRLFVERAQAARASFTLDASNASSVAEICRRLDGIPLAIELASARIAAMSPGEIAGLLDERFRLLTGGRRTAVERHHTLRATVEWSYSLLSEQERLAFDRLGVFAGTFDANAARAVVGDDQVGNWEVLDALASLVDQSMLSADEDVDGTTRYQMLETLRHYARERLEEGGVGDVWRARHAAYFADLAEEAGVALYGPLELAWRRRLHADLDNLRAAVVWSLDSSVETDRETALRIISALAYEVTLDRASGIGTWAERAVPAARTSNPGRRTAVLAAAAMSLFNRGDLDEARLLIAEALQDGIAADCPTPLMGYVTSAALLVHAGEHAEALAQLEDAVTRLDDRDLYGRSNLLAVAANFETLRGHHADARAHADESLRLAHELGNPSQLAIAFAALGFACVDSAPDDALAALEESRAVTLAGASDVQNATALSLMGLLRARAGDAVGALDALREGLVCATEVGWRVGAAGVLAQVSTVLMMGTASASGVVICAHVTTSGLDLVAGEALMPWSEALANTRRALGDKEYEAAWALGTALSYEEVVEYAFDQLGRILREAAEV